MGERRANTVDRDALADFCRAEYPRLVGVLGLYCGNVAVAEELAQEALARAWERWPRVRQLETPQAWVQRVALNLANSHLRRLAAERRALQKVGPGRDSHEGPRPDDAAVRAAVAALPRRQKTALVLHYYLDLSVVETAARMGTTESSVKSLLRRSLQRLRASESITDLREVPDVP